MNATLLGQLVNAVLYEGYILYPYRPSSKKNSRERFTFGRIYPEAYNASQNGAEACVMQTECLQLNRAENSTTEISVRFLHPIWREVGLLPAPLKELPSDEEPPYRVVSELSAGGKLYQSWQEAVEREVKLAPVSLQNGRRNSVIHPFAFPASRRTEPIPDESGSIVGVLVRRQEALEGTLEVKTSPESEGCFKITVRIVNQTALPVEAGESQDAVILRTLASTHTILRTNGGEFISLVDPPREFKRLADGCRNIGTWPVLVGDETKSERDTMLSSPIILYDYPKIAPESGGDFGDATEIDEMLTLRVATMTDGEKHEMRNVDGFARRILERTETMSSDRFLKMHGTLRDMKAAEEFFNPSRRIKSTVAKGVVIKAGDRVRLRPNGRADAFDLMLAGKTAVVEAVEQDAEDKIHLAVVLEDDPGKDLGMMRQPGHRFFYGLDEVEPLSEVAV